MLGRLLGEPWIADEKRQTAEYGGKGNHDDGPETHGRMSSRDQLMGAMATGVAAWEGVPDGVSPFS